jgi:hypothetical protein
MPLEIRELHIKVNVNESQGRALAGMAGARTTGESPTDERDRLLAQCVEEVMAIIERRKER